MIFEHPTPDQMTVGVVGAGIAGLTCAMRLRQAGFGIELFEASERTGGTLRTHREGPWRAELGPNTVPDRGGELIGLIDELGLRPRLLKPSSSAPTRYIVKGGELWPLPRSAQEFLATPLLSGPAKLRLAAEALVPKRQAEPGFDESLYSLASRRFGEEVAQMLLDPFIAGTYAGSLKRLSSTYALGKLARVRAGLRLRAARRHRGPCGQSAARVPRRPTPPRPPQVAC